MSDATNEVKNDEKAKRGCMVVPTDATDEHIAAIKAEFGAQVEGGADSVRVVRFDPPVRAAIKEFVLELATTLDDESKAYAIPLLMAYVSGLVRGGAIMHSVLDLEGDEDEQQAKFIATCADFQASEQVSQAIAAKMINLGAILKDALSDVLAEQGAGEKHTVH